MKTKRYLIPSPVLLFLLLVNSTVWSGVIYDYNVNVEYDQHERYVSSFEDLTKILIIKQGILREMTHNLRYKKKTHRANVLYLQLQADFKILIKKGIVKLKTMNITISGNSIKTINFLKKPISKNYQLFMLLILALMSCYTKSKLFALPINRKRN